VFRALRDYEFPRFTVVVDGTSVTHHATGAILGNIRTYGGPFCVAPLARPDDGLLDVCVFRGSRALRYAAYMIAATVGWHVLLPGVTYHRAKRVRLEKAPSRGGSHTSEAPVQLDGDARGHVPISFEIVPRAVRIVVP